MCPISGGNWNNTSNAGVWALNWNNARGNSNDNVGFRSDSGSPRTGKPDGGTKGGVFRHGQNRAKSWCIRLSGRLILEGQAK
jgi:hypothetical protein